MKLDCITVTKILGCFRASARRKWRNRLKNKRFAVLAEYFEQQTNCSGYRRKISQSRRSPSWKNQTYLPFLIKQMGTMPRAINSRPRNLITALEKYFWFQWNCKQGTVWQTVRFISQFFLVKLYIQFWKYFRSMILGSVGRGYCKKK